MSNLKTYRFSDIYEISSGISSKPEQAGHGKPFLSFSTVFNNYFLPDELPDLMDISEEEEKTYSIKEGDIFLTRTSETLDELGMSSVAVKNYPKASYSGFLKRIRPIKHGITYPKFMAFYLRSKLFRKTMNNNAIMTLRASFNEQIFSYLELILPEFDEQKKIGDLLYSMSQKIELNNKINAELEGIAKLIYEYWFVQFDFPYDFAQGKPADESSDPKDVKPYKSSGGKMVWNKELKREIPEGWEVKEFKDIIFPVNESIQSNECLELKYLPIDKLPSNSLYYDEYDERKNAQSSLIKFEEDDILLGAMRVYFHRVCNAIESGISRSTIMVFRSFDITNKNYALFTLNTQYAIEFATVNSTGTSIPYAKWSNGLDGYKLSFPDSKTLIIKFDEFVKPILNNFKILSKENQELSSLRDWLLPMLMNGQLKIK